MNAGGQTSQTDNGLRLWGVSFKVRPTPAHPKYYDWQHGILAVAIYAKDDQSAGKIAGEIMGHLPYEVIDPAVWVTEAEKLPSGWTVAVEHARRLGIGIALAAMPTGSNEAEFEAIW